QQDAGPRHQLDEPLTLAEAPVAFNMPACQGGLPVWENTDLVRFHDSRGLEIDEYIPSRNQSVNIVMTGNTVNVTEKVAQTEARRRRNLGGDDFADFRRHADGIEAPVIFQVLNVSLQRPIDFCR